MLKKSQITAVLVKKKIVIAIIMMVGKIWGKVSFPRYFQSKFEK
jgi:hypothetical protein